MLTKKKKYMGLILQNDGEINKMPNSLQTMWM